MKFIPYDYQRFATNYLLEKPVAAIYLDMGLGMERQSLLYQQFMI